MSTITLIKAKTLRTRLTSLVSDSINNTVSLAYYSMIDGNVSPLANCEKNITTSLNPLYRQFICAEFKDGKWGYSRAKADKMLETLGLQINKTAKGDTLAQDASTFEQFVTAIDASVLAKQAALDDKKAQDAALTPAEIKANHLKRIESYLLAQLKNISALELSTIVAKLKTVAVSAPVATDMKINAVTAS